MQKNVGLFLSQILVLGLLRDSFSHMTCPTFTARQRAILVDWMVSVVMDCELAPRVAHHATRLLDDYMKATSAIDAARAEKGIVVVNTKNGQLFGACCLLIASKFDQQYQHLQPHSLCRFSLNTFTVSECVKMELHILNHFGFAVSRRVLWDFVEDEVQKITEQDKSWATAPRTAHMVAQYVAGLCLTQIDFLDRFSLTEIAHHIVAFARDVYNKQDEGQCRARLVELVGNGESARAIHESTDQQVREIAKQRNTITRDNMDMERDS